MNDLATKGDIQQLELRLDAKIATVKNDLLRWMIPLFLAQLGGILALYFK